MSLPTGMIPVLVFVVTVGVSVPVTLTGYLLQRHEEVATGSAMRAAIFEVSMLYLVGVGVVWAIAGTWPLWGVPAALIIIGVGTLVGLVALPLVTGRTVVKLVGNVHAETALRYSAYSWPIAMIAVFLIFISPGGLTHGHLFDLEGAQTCLVGFCGISGSLAAAVLVEALIAVFGPGLLGSLLVSQRGAGHT